jgi:urease accessory protein
MSTAQLRLFQLVSPALPVGAFSYSEGLEVLVQAGRLATPGALEAWLRAELERGAIGLEAAALPGLAAALGRARSASTAGQGGDWAAAMAEVAERDGWLLATRESAEVRAQQRQMGRSLLRLLADLGWSLPVGTSTSAQADASPGNASDSLAWPAAWAWAGVCLDLAPADLVEAYLYSWVANQISAAVRLVPLGPTQGQRLQLALAPCWPSGPAPWQRAIPASSGAAAWAPAWPQLGHRELYSCLFRS